MSRGGTGVGAVEPDDWALFVSQWASPKVLPSSADPPEPDPADDHDLDHPDHVTHQGVAQARPAAEEASSFSRDDKEKEKEQEKEKPKDREADKDKERKAKKKSKKKKRPAEDKDEDDDDQEDEEGIPPPHIFFSSLLFSSSVISRLQNHQPRARINDNLSISSLAGPVKIQLSVKIFARQGVIQQVDVIDTVTSQTVAGMTSFQLLLWGGKGSFDR